MSKKERLFQLAAKADEQLKQFYTPADDDEDQQQGTSLPRMAGRGAAAGAGLSLAASCDFRIASDKAVFTSAFSKIGAFGDYLGSYFITKLVGPSKAKSLYFFSDKLNAQQALEIGLVDRVVPDDKLEEETLAFARRLAGGPPVAYRLIKQNINAAMSQRLEDVMAMESRNMVRSLNTEDSKEAVRAFLEKREAKFSGR